MKKDELKKQLLEIMPPIFARDRTRELTGGLIDNRTMANLDSLGEGPPHRIKLRGRKIGYIREHFIDWFVGRLEIQD